MLLYLVILAEFSLAILALFSWPLVWAQKWVAAAFKNWPVMLYNIESPFMPLPGGTSVGQVAERAKNEKHKPRGEMGFGHASCLQVIATKSPLKHLWTTKTWPSYGAIIYIYMATPTAVKLGSGPILALWTLRFWTKSTARLWNLDQDDFSLFGELGADNFCVLKLVLCVFRGSLVSANVVKIPFFEGSDKSENFQTIFFRGQGEKKCLFWKQ